LSEKHLSPCISVDCMDPINDAFNYYLSQLRIRVEMAFGRLVNMFCMLSGRIEESMDRVWATLTTCARLHNFIMSEERLFDMTYASAKDEL